jgi:hypothetical protein
MNNSDKMKFHYVAYYLVYKSKLTVSSEITNGKGYVFNQILVNTNI